MLHSRGRVAASIVAIFAILLGYSFASTAAAAPPTVVTPTSVAPAAPVTPQQADFTPRFDTNAAGDIKIIGNTLMSCQSGLSGCAEARTAAGKKLSNNDWAMQWINDAGGATNSSSADLAIPAGAPVLFAGLYWSSGDGSSNKGSVPAGANVIRFKVPGGGYQNITASTIYDDSAKEWTYSAFANVTSLVNAHKSGTYSVADIKGQVGEKNLFAGWSLIIAYADSNEPVRALTVFDGLKSVSSSNNVTINVSGFKTPPTGPVRTTLGMVAGEGDLGLTGDQFQLRNPANVYESLGDTQRPTTNFFNSTITENNAQFTAKSPNFKNQLGYDAGEIDATGKIANNATSASFKATSTGDIYFPTALTFATELFSPRYDAQKSVTDLNGQTPLPNDVLQYDLTLKNDTTADTGDVSSNTIITDRFPTGATYVPGTLRVNGSPVPDAGGVATISGQNLTLRVGTGADATKGGELAVGASVTVSYQLRINGGTAPGTVLTNQFDVNGTAKTAGFPVTGTSNETHIEVDNLSADLSIVKTPLANPVAAGGIANYSLVVANAGPDAAGQVTVRDTISAPSTFVSAAGSGWSCTFATPTLTCTRPQLADGDTAPTIAVQVAIPPDTGSGVIQSNTATVGGFVPDPDPNNNTSTSHMTVERSADLVMGKSHLATNPDGSVDSGSNLIWNLTVTNRGVSESTGARVTDTLPAGLQIIGIASSAEWDCTASTSSKVDCTYQQPLKPGDSALPIRVDAQIPGDFATAQITNTANVTGNEPDPFPDNNTKDDVTKVRLSVDLVESIYHTGGTNPGDAGLITVPAINAGPGEIDAGTVVTQTVTLPAGLTYAGNPGGGWSCALATNILTCTQSLVSAVGEGDSLPTLTFNVAISPSVTPPVSLPVSATVSLPPNVHEIETGNNTASTVISVNEAKIDLALSTTDSVTLVPGGPSVTAFFTPTLDPTSPASAQGPYQIVLTKPSGIDVATHVGSAWNCVTADPIITCTLPAQSVVPGGTLPLLIFDLSTGPATPVGHASLPGVLNSTNANEDDIRPSNNFDAVPILIRPFAALEVTKTPNPATESAAGTTTYTLTVKNNGPSDAQNVILRDDFGGLGLAIESVNPGPGAGWTCGASAAEVQCEMGTPLAPGESRSVDVVARTDSGILTPNTTIVNKATATQTSIGEGGSAEATITVNPFAHLHTVKSAPVGFPAGSLIAGRTVVYRIDVTNQGPSAAKDLTMTDTLPAGMTYVVATGDGWSCSLVVNTPTCTSSAILPPNGTAPPIFLTALLDPGATGEVTNSATTAPPAGTGDGDTGTTTGNVESLVDLDIAHSGPAIVNGGNDWVTSVSVRNDGPSNDPGPIDVVIDQTGGTPKSATGTGWNCTVNGQQIRCRYAGGATAGATLPAITVTTGTSPTGTQVNSEAHVTGTVSEIDYTNNRSSTSATILNTADLHVTKVVNAPVVQPGATITFTVRVLNNGPGAATAVQVTDTLPVGFTFVPKNSDPRCNVEPGKLTCFANGVLQKGQSTSFRLNVKVPTSAKGTYTNKAVGSSPERDPNPANNTGTAKITVQIPQVPLVKPPTTITPGGITPLYPGPVPTNARQNATVAITCTPVVRGDLRPVCRLIRGANGSYSIYVKANTPLIVRIVVSAPAKPPYTAMRIVYSYRVG